MHDQGRTFSAILATLNNLEYRVEWIILNSVDFRIPQVRKQVFIVGYFDPRYVGKILPILGTDRKALMQVLGGPQGSGVYNPRGTACTQTAGDGGKGVETGLYLMEPDTVRSYFVGLCIGRSTPTEDVKCLTVQHSQTTLHNHRGERSGVLLVKEATKRGYKEAAIGDTVDLGHAGSNTRRRYMGHDIAHTLETSYVQGIVERDGRVRRLMPRESLRLQGFTGGQIDKILTFTSDAQAYKQVGNGVTIMVTEAIGRRTLVVDEGPQKMGSAVRPA